MGVDIGKLIDLIYELIRIEGKIEEAIKNEKDKKKRKAIRKAYKNRDTSSLHDLWFKL